MLCSFVRLLRFRDVQVQEAPAPIHSAARGLEPPVAAEVLDDKFRQVIDDVMRMIQEQYMSDISLESCADHFGITHYTLSKKFCEMTGMNFIDYLTQVRMDKAKELLVSSNQSVQDIAGRVGYQPSYFYRIFKRHAEMTPSAFRELYRQGSG